MAGSYHHVVDEQGRLRTPTQIADMLDTPSDVYEAIEHMYGIIWTLAYDISQAVPALPVVVVATALEDTRRGHQASPGKGYDYDMED